jgi:two-component system chemotaxis sensor kinase CheA
VPAELRVIDPLIQRLRRECATTNEPQPAAEAPAKSSVEEQQPAGAARGGTEEKGSKARAIKVDTEKLDYLVDMVGEMVIAQSLVQHDPAARNPQLARNLGQLARITEEVQRTAMSMRMIPVAGLFQRMSRLVRDLARKAGKRAQLELSGEDVELDRNIVEELSDPLMHMIRNSMDHGIEPPDVRAAAGKPEVARIDLKAFHLAGQIVIQVIDDGRGLDHDKIIAKARSKGLISDGATLTDNEIVNLIFEPGFSTAEQVSDISGRGVGMDVVRRQIQKLRGIIDVRSTPGRGTEFSLRLPLTMAIIDGLVVTVGTERFIVPMFAVRELLRPTPDMLSTVEGSAEVVLVRNKLLPMVRLHERFKIDPQVRKAEEGVLVISDGDSHPFALLVDQVLGKQEVVIKNLGALFQNVQGVAGGAILGDGRVGLILDLQRVFD